LPSGWYSGPQQGTNFNGGRQVRVRSDKHVRCLSASYYFQRQTRVSSVCVAKLLNICAKSRHQHADCPTILRLLSRFPGASRAEQTPEWARSLARWDQPDAGPFDRLAGVIQRVLHLIRHEVRHLPVEVPCQFDEARFDARLFGFPGKIEWVDGNAVAAEARSRVEGHKAERLGGGVVDDLPDVDPDAVAHQCHFVHQTNVDHAERVFEELPEQKSTLPLGCELLCWLQLLDYARLLLRVSMRANAARPLNPNPITE
jgi:hypothetical protein